MPLVFRAESDLLQSTLQPQRHNSGQFEPEASRITHQSRPKITKIEETYAGAYNGQAGNWLCDQNDTWTRTEERSLRGGYIDKERPPQWNGKEPGKTWKQFRMDLEH